MKVLFLCHYYSPRIGGVEKHVSEIGKELIKNGYEVTVLTSKFDQCLKNDEILDNIRVKRIDLNIDWNKPSKLKIWIWILRNIRFISGFDVIHIHDVHFWVLPISLLFRPKMYMTFHGFEGKYPPSIGAILIRKLAKFLTRKNICIGAYIQKWYGTNADEISYGAVRKAKVSKISPKYFFCFIGRLSCETGADLFIKAFSKITPRQNIIFLGDGPLKNEAKKIGLVLGFKKNISQYINNANYIFATGYLSLLDAYIHRKVAFASYNNPLRLDYYKMSPHGKLANIVNSEKQLIDKIKYYENNSLAKDVFINHAYEWASNQSYSKLLNQYINLWKK